jgi:diguanylate cyclase (GGDEF)-like protein
MTEAARPDGAEHTAAHHDALVEAAAAISQGEAPAETLRLVATLAGAALDAAWCDIYDYERQEDEFVVAAYYQAPELDVDLSDWTGMKYDAENWPQLRDCVAERRVAVRYRDAPDLSAEEAVVMDEWSELSGMSAPLVYRGEVLGMLEVGESRSPRRWREAEVRFLQAVADLTSVGVALARARARLEEQAITDELTGLFNFRHFMDRLRREVAVARRYGQDLSLLMVDLDGFRLYNQTFGRERGDRTLVEVAEILRGVTRGDVDIIARYGADEFLIILPQTRANDPEPLTAAAVATRVRERISAHRFENDAGQRDVALTASIGIAGVGLGGYSAEELLGCVDKAIYLAKRDGRDRIVTFGA